MKDDLRPYIEALKSESDRGCVLAGSSWIQDFLEISIREALLPMNKSLDDVRKRTLLNRLVSNDEYDPPLGRSGPRLAICEVMGIIDTNMSLLIQEIQRLRNRYFAHLAGPCSLSDQTVQRQLDRTRQRFENWQSELEIKLIPQIDFGVGGYSKQRIEFMRWILNLSAHLFVPYSWRFDPTASNPEDTTSDE